ncbi:hypothetical protein FEMY_14510 [Ferrovum myxofaciens]|jgi:hypothetical protein|uniref:Uncharacterized protein n=2 Tax=Ferrovum myxofaciens TaxID=416213 RepID=A0A149VXN9_9PROT|nr:hypothetical protein FEMY_14510 [Ferrovum myxofaciens]
MNAHHNYDCGNLMHSIELALWMWKSIQKAEIEGGAYFYWPVDTTNPHSDQKTIQNPKLILFDILSIFVLYSCKFYRMSDSIIFRRL